MVAEVNEETRTVLPDDASSVYSDAVLSWTGKYGIGIEDLLRHRVVYSPSRKQLIFPFYERSASLYENNQQTPALWQARNFGNTKTRYITKGAKEKVLCLVAPKVWNHPNNVDERPTGCLSSGISAIPPEEVFSTTNKVCCIVEDCLSAYKATRALGAFSIPCLGSTIGRDKLARLRAVLGPSTRFVVWLDSNMYDKAQQIAQRLQLLGAQAQVVWTEDDPKEYSDTEIVTIVKSLAFSSQLL